MLVWGPRSQVVGASGAICGVFAGQAVWLYMNRGHLPPELVAQWLRSVLVMAVFLGPDVVGVMAVIDKLIAVVVQTASLSLPFAAVRFLPAFWVSDRAGCWQLFRSMSNTVVATAVIAMVLAIAATAINPAIWGTEFASRSPLLFAALFRYSSLRR